MNILKIRVNEVDRIGALEKVAGFLSGNGQYKIFTPNPEMLVDARNDEYFRDVLNSGDLNICDGVGLVLATRGKLKKIAGVDFMLDICGLAQEKNKSVYLLGSGDESVIKLAAEALKKKFSGLKICGFNKGLKIEKSEYQKIDYDETGNEDLLYDIIMKAPDILFVGFGHGKQEKWIYENSAQLPSVKVAMGVGGAFDFLAGKAKRAPKFVRMLGLEWLWRLILEPWRIKRIFKATIVFLYYLIWQH
ncbi:MAG: WecB/TagA/CpsF family glycosyltransferase [Candidatus Magasanikbacteria bacterium]|nr:WecB/TagA/CpsF family glycosyltransferase [Candidatus Magasanikbacteria bacterium]